MSALMSCTSASERGGMRESRRMIASSSDWVIRPFVLADQHAARRLILDGLKEHFGVLDEACNPDIDDVAASYVDRGHLFLVAEDGCVLIGTGALLFEDARVGRLVRVSVARPWRRQGLGRALVQHLIEAARSRGVVRLWMETNDDWSAAIGLYAACGFAEVDRRDGNIYMALDLSRNQSSILA